MTIDLNETHRHIDSLYFKDIECPVCYSSVKGPKVKQSSIQVLRRDADHCVHCKGIHPLFYEVWICGNCGYADENHKFGNLKKAEIELIRCNIMPRWNQRKFEGVRSIEQAIEVFEIALFNLVSRSHPKSELAKVCIRIAWLYRMKNDKGNERKFLELARKSYTEAYTNESFSLETSDEVNCMYLIAEISRRLGETNEAISWFSKLISNPLTKHQPQLLELAREQLHLTKEEHHILAKQEREETQSYR